MAFLKSVNSYVRFRSVLYRRLALEASFATFGVVGIFLGGITPIDIMNASVSIISGYMFAIDIKEIWSRNQRTRLTSNVEYGNEIANLDLPDGFRLHSGTVANADSEILPLLEAGVSVKELRPYISNAALNKKIDFSNNKIVIMDKNYSVPERLKEHRARCINVKQPSYNESKIGLRTDIEEIVLSSSRDIFVQKTDYFSGISTNEMACDQFELVSEDRKQSPEVLIRLSDLIVNNSKIISISDSLLSNHIGITTVILSSDNQLILQEELHKGQEKNSISVGGSGSVDFEDCRSVGSEPTLQSICKYAMEREAAEELSATYLPGQQSTVLTGYARYIARGGKPEFFGITRSLTSEADMKPAPGEEYVAHIWGVHFLPTRSGLIKVIDTIVQDRSVNLRYSLSTIVALRLAREWLDNAEVSLLEKIDVSA